MEQHFPGYPERLKGNLITILNILMPNGYIMVPWKITGGIICQLYQIEHSNRLLSPIIGDRSN